MGRPRKFDESQALDRAVELFWTQGFELTSTQELATTMGIGQQSLYNTFGDKQRLFLRALARYRERVIDPALASLEGETASRPEIEGYFRWLVIALSSSIGRRACFMVNSIVERALLDPETKALSHRHLLRLEEAFASALARAAARGELRTSLAPVALARHLVTVAHGLNVMAKGGASKKTLADATRVALSVLDHEKGSR